MDNKEKYFYRGRWWAVEESLAKEMIKKVIDSSAGIVITEEELWKKAIFHIEEGSISIGLPIVKVPKEMKKNMIQVSIEVIDDDLKDIKE